MCGAQGPREGLSPTWVAYTTPSSVPGDMEQPLPRTFFLGEGRLCLDSCRPSSSGPHLLGVLGPRVACVPTWPRSVCLPCTVELGRGEGCGPAARLACAGPARGTSTDPQPETPLVFQERPKPRVPILHFRAARPPFVICVKLVSVRCSHSQGHAMTVRLVQAPVVGSQTSDVQPDIHALGLGHLCGAAGYGERWRSPLSGGCPGCRRRPPWCPHKMGCTCVK